MYVLHIDHWILFKYEQCITIVYFRIVCFLDEFMSLWPFALYSMFASCDILSKDVSIKDNIWGWVKLVLFSDHLFHTTACRAQFQCVLASYLRLTLLKFRVPSFTANILHPIDRSLFVQVKWMCGKQRSFVIVYFRRGRLPDFLPLYRKSCHYIDSIAK